MKVDILREGFKNKTKKSVENSTREGGGGSGGRFSTGKKNQKKNHGLKALDFA